MTLYKDSKQLKSRQITTAILAAAIVAGMAIRGSAQAQQTFESVPPAIMTPDKVNTSRLGPLVFSNKK